MFGIFHNIYLHMSKKKTLKKLKSKTKWKEVNDGVLISVKKKKHITTKLNEWNSQRTNPRKQIKVEELNNGVVPKKTLVEIGKGGDKRNIDISQYILKK
ncbi:hypothetical protein OAC91_02470 [Candidatus Marinimicrobia bacterium]|nr:hypothetical protein [Candidatus Neomarinimicrobiota bacterium]